MNIKEAKTQIKNAIIAYFTKDEYERFIIPPEKQRPVFLIGPPGIGKTAIMEQIAEDMGVGLLSYSMTHHTRQSALGLPFIERKIYDGKEYAVSEYTMSEIIASIYEMMEETGIKEGILFLDEINCVSETLSPIMLQFLQYKVFGKHKIPEGWIVVSAGNPPEYNDSVREFDMVTWDRVKRIDVEAEYEVWKEYAYKVGIHPVIMTYLEIKKDHFYKVESTLNGKSFVTARAWDDLSQMIYLYERHDLALDINLISQYLQNKNIAQDFSIYYELFNKYQSDYEVDKIIEGNYNKELVNRSAMASFDERLSLLGLLLDSINSIVIECISQEEILSKYKDLLLSAKNKISSKEDDIVEIWQSIIRERREELNNRIRTNSISIRDEKQEHKVIIMMENYLIELRETSGLQAGFDFLKEQYYNLQKDYLDKGKVISEKLSNVFKFLEESFDKGNEMIIFMSELTLNPYSSRFINQFGCQEFFENNKALLVYDRGQKIKMEIEELVLE